MNATEKLCLLSPYLYVAFFFLPILGYEKYITPGGISSYIEMQHLVNTTWVCIANREAHCRDLNILP